ncbi:DUF5906 domain-containing protein, partial [Ancylothrix sp. C2]|uniref:DNA primase family protein n=1 Tax=Ancylothrix sp. D3o TaxID=2953691 RepID=UPI0021BB08B4
NTFSAHQPENNINWCLPYEYNSEADCPHIQQWMHEMCEGDTQLVQLLRAYLNAIVNRRACDFHRYLEIIGPGGTGKSTFMNLAMAMVGKENVLSTSFKKLETSRFETANLEGKLLALLTDSERYAGEISIFKAMTGGDPIPYEQKFKQATEGFVFNGMAIVVANEIVQCSDYTSGLKRRRISIRMNKRIEPKNQRNLIRHDSQQNCFTGEFVPELPGLMNWVLGMSDAEVSNYIKRTDEFVLGLCSVEKETLISTNPIATWVDHCLVLRSGYKTYIGRAPQEKDRSNPDYYQFVGRWLYPNYAEFSRATGHSVVSLNRFVANLHDLLINQLRLDNVLKSSDNQGSFWLGIKIRGEHDSDPFIITGNPLPPSPPSGPSGFTQPMSPKPTAPGGVANGSAVSHAAQVATLERCSVDNVNGHNSTGVGDDGMTSVMTPVMTKTFTATDCDDCDGFFKKSVGVSDNNFDGVSGKLVGENFSNEIANVEECSKTIDLSGIGSSLGSSLGSPPGLSQPASGDVQMPVEPQRACGDVQMPMTSEPACGDVFVPVEPQPACGEDVEISLAEELKSATTSKQINKIMVFLNAEIKVRAWQRLSDQQQQETARVIASSLQECEIQEQLQEFCCLPALVKTQVWALLSDSQKQRLQNLPKWVAVPSNMNIKGLAKWLIELNSVENGRIFASADAMVEFYTSMESWYNNFSAYTRHIIYISGFWERASAVFNARIFDDVRDCLFRVRQFVGTHIDPQIIWIENCRLVEVPAPPYFNFYKFVTADGQIISVAGGDSFEVMEVGT